MVGTLQRDPETDVRKTAVIPAVCLSVCSSEQSTMSAEKGAAGQLRIILDSYARLCKERKLPVVQPFVDSVSATCGLDMSLDVIRSADQSLLLFEALRKSAELLMSVRISSAASRPVTQPDPLPSTVADTSSSLKSTAGSRRSMTAASSSSGRSSTAGRALAAHGRSHVLEDATASGSFGRTLQVLLGRGSVLARLDLVNVPLTVNLCAHLGEGFLQNKTVCDVTVDGCSVSDEGIIAIIRGLRMHPAVQTLSLQKNALSDISSAAISDLLKSQLFRRNSLLWESSLRGSFCAADQPPGLTAVSLRGNHLSNRTAEAVAEFLQEDTWLLSLDLAENDICSWSSLAVLLRAGCVTNETLQFLDVSGNPAVLELTGRRPARSASYSGSDSVDNIGPSGCRSATDSRDRWLEENKSWLKSRGPPVSPAQFIFVRRPRRELDDLTSSASLVRLSKEIARLVEHHNETSASSRASNSAAAAAVPALGIDRGAAPTDSGNSLAHGLLAASTAIRSLPDSAADPSALDISLQTLQAIAALDELAPDVTEDKMVAVLENTIATFHGFVSRIETDLQQRNLPTQGPAAPAKAKALGARQSPEKTKAKSDRASKQEARQQHATPQAPPAAAAAEPEKQGSVDDGGQDVLQKLRSHACRTLST